MDSSFESVVVTLAVATESMFCFHLFNKKVHEGVQDFYALLLRVFCRIKPKAFAYYQFFVKVLFPR